MRWYNFIFSDRPIDRARRHIIFWLLWWVYFAVTYYYYMQVGLNEIIFGKLNYILFFKTFVFIIIHIIACYYFIYFLLPGFLSKRNRLSFAAGIVMLIVFLLFTGYLIHSWLYPLINKTYHYKLGVENNMLWWMSINLGLINAPKIITIATAIKLIKRWYIKQKEKERIEKEKLITDLQLLKAQIRPDFLFSSLDQIYNYALNRQPMAQELLLKFSDLLSYLLYECDDESVLLKKELDMMKEYLVIEKLRYGPALEMEIEMKGNALNNRIAPLLLLPFIDKSLRQCNTAAIQSWINMELSIENNLFIMKLMNGTGMYENDVMDKEIIAVRKRLQLLYPKMHELKMYQENEISVTVLKINLAFKPTLQSLNTTISPREEKIYSSYAFK